MRILTLGLAAALALAATAAGAHPKMVAASPAAGGAVAGSPTAIRISFNEAVFPKLSGVQLKGPRGAAVKTGAASVDATRKQLIVPVAATLKPGRYLVAWHAVSTDTHHVKGQFGFTVK